MRKMPSKMDVAPLYEHLIKVVLDGLDGSGSYWMVFNCIQWYSRAFDGIWWYWMVLMVSNGISGIQWSSMVFNGIQWYWWYSILDVCSTVVLCWMGSDWVSPSGMTITMRYRAPPCENIFSLSDMKDCHGKNFDFTTEWFPLFTLFS